MQHQHDQQYGIGDLPPHPLLAMLAASSATSQKVEQASSSFADGKEDGDSIESKLRSLKLTCHDPEHSDSAVSSEGSSGEDSRTQPRSVIDYYTSADTDDALSGAGFDYVLEVYSFSPSLRTKDIISELLVYGSSAMSLKWVDDTHALAIYKNASDARIASMAPYSKFKARLLEKTTHEASLLVANAVAAERREDLINEKWSGGKPLQRPKTTSAVARRMVSHALGVRLRESEKGIKEMKQRS